MSQNHNELNQISLLRNCERIKEFDHKKWVDKNDVIVILNAKNLNYLSNIIRAGKATIIIGSENFQNLILKENLNLEQLLSDDTPNSITIRAERRLETEFSEITRIGKGQYGKVFKAKHIMSDHYYAIKVVKVKSAKAKKEIENEVKNLAKLSHGNVINYKTAWIEIDPSDILAQNSIECESSSSLSQSYISPFMAICDNDQRPKSSVSNHCVSESESGQTDSNQNSTESRTNKSRFLNRCFSDSESSLQSSSKDSTTKILPVSDRNLDLNSPGNSIVEFKYSETEKVEENGDHDINENGGDYSVEELKRSPSKPSVTNTQMLFTVFIQMELCEMDLDKWLESRNTDLPELRWKQESSDLARQLIRGLEYIHSRSIIHRDIKPANIFIVKHNNRNHLKIGDFGFATDIEERKCSTNEQLNLSGGIGTPIYMAPEIRNYSQYDYKADIYSSSIVLLQIMLRKITIRELSDISIGLQNTEENYKHEQLDKWEYEKKVIKKMHHKDPQQRPTAHDLVNDEVLFIINMSKEELLDIIYNLQKENEALKKQHNLK